MTLQEKLEWRYATKRMTGKKITTEQLNTVLDAIQLAPTSMGLQPYNVLVISNPELKQKIHAGTCPQPQILEASELLVFAPWTNVHEAQITAYIENIAAIRSMPIDALTDFKNNIIGLTKRAAVENQNWAAKQAYIGLGFGLVAAADLGIDATPMEGFNAAALDELLGLKEKGLASAAIMALGHRDTENDYLVNAKKVRRDKSQFFTYLD